MLPGVNGVAGQFKVTEIELPALLDREDDDALARRALPAASRAATHAIGSLEQLKGEIGRGTCVCGIFPTEPAIERLVGAALLGRNDEAAVQRSRVTTLEIIVPIGDDDAVGPPTRAAWPFRPQPVTVAALPEPTPRSGT